MATLQIVTALSDEPGIARDSLKVGDMPDGRPMQIPVLIGRGAAPGPTLWLHACVHGNEACGAFVIHRLFRALDASPASSSGCPSSTSRPRLFLRDGDQAVVAFRTVLEAIAQKGE